MVETVGCALRTETMGGISGHECIGNAFEIEVYKMVHGMHPTMLPEYIPKP